MAEHSLELDEDDNHSAGGHGDDDHDAADHGGQGDHAKMAVKIVMVTMKMAADKKVPPVAGSVVARTCGANTVWKCHLEMFIDHLFNIIVKMVQKQGIFCDYDPLKSAVQRNYFLPRFR